MQIIDDIKSLKSKKRLLLSDLTKSVYWAIYEEISKAISSYKPQQILFHAELNSVVVPSCVCGNTLKWNDDTKNYRKFCSKKCTATYTVESRKKARVAAGLSEWHTQDDEWKIKTKETSLAKFGATHYSKTKDFVDRVIKTNLLNFNAAYPSQSDLGQERMKKTFIDKYGVDNPSKYPKIRKLQVDTWKKNHYSTQALELMSNDDLFYEEITNFPIALIAKKYDISVYPIYARCKALGIKPTIFKISQFEQEIIDFVKLISPEIDIIVSDRSILTTKEIDIYIPALKLAIECNGTYWHSETNGRGRDYHVSKTNECRDAGVKLMHVWEHDWAQKNNIIKSIIISKLGKTDRLFARKTKVNEIDSITANKFFAATHLQGPVTGNTINVGLYDTNEQLISVMGFGKSRFNRAYQYELLRYSSKLNTTIVGGASKLFCYFVTNHSPKSIISYADLSHSVGNVYLKLGFHHTGFSKPGYHYTKDYVNVYNRYHFQKHTLEKKLDCYDAALSEWQNMINNGYDRIWDCGNNIYVWNNNSL